LAHGENSHIVFNIKNNLLEYYTFVALNEVESDKYSEVLQKDYDRYNNRTQDYYWFLYIKSYTKTYTATYKKAKLISNELNDIRTFNVKISDYQKQLSKYVELNIISRIDTKNTTYNFDEIIEYSLNNDKNRLYQFTVATQYFYNLRNENLEINSKSINELRSHCQNYVTYIQYSVLEALYSNKYKDFNRAKFLLTNAINDIPNSILKNKYYQLVSITLMNLYKSQNNIDSALYYNNIYFNTLSNNLNSNYNAFDSDITQIDTINISKLDAFNQLAKIHLQEFKLKNNISSCEKAKHFSERSLEKLYQWSNSLYFQDYIHLTQGKKNDAISTALESNYNLYEETSDSTYLFDFINIIGRNSGDYLSLQKRNSSQLDNINQDSIEYYELTLNKRFDTNFIKRLKNIPENIAIVSFTIKDSILYKLICSKSEIQVFKSKINKQLFKDFISLQKNPSTKFTTNKIVINTSNLLLADWYQDGYEKILIHRDNLLHDISFECLITNSNKYLIENSEITYISQLDNIKSKKAKLSQNTKIYGFSYSELDKSEWKYDLALPELPGAIIELDAITKSSINHKLFYGLECNLKTIQKSLSQANSISHLALHGYSNTDFIDDNYLLIKRKNNIDSILGKDLIKIDINADLVILSACDSYSGKIITGEGKYSLTRIFEIAGAKNIISSLWQLDDASSSQIFENFYSSIKNANSYNKILRQSKLLLISQDELSHPYYWGSLIFTLN